MTDSTFTGNNSGLDGGAIRSDSGNVTATGSTFTGNSVGRDGGAVYAYGLVTATNSTFTGNTANRYGGAINSDDSVTATGSTFTGNSATITGGAIYATDVALVYATVVANSASRGANVYAGTGLTSFGSVVAHPLGNGANCEIDGSTSSYSYADDLSCGFDDPTDDQAVGNDPRLLALGNFGGPTQTRPPQVNSPLVDAIPVADCDPPVVVTDQRGLPRPAEGNGVSPNGCDIGAVELQPAPPPPPPPPYHRRGALSPASSRPRCRWPTSSEHLVPDSGLGRLNERRTWPPW